MNYFLEDKDHENLQRMSILRTAMYENSNGTKVSGKMLLMGENVVKFTQCKMFTSARGNKYLSLEFTRPSTKVLALSTPVTFAPYYDYVFDVDGAIRACKAFGHVLKAKPEDMLMEVYLNHVGQRLGTFVGTELSVWVNYTQLPRKDSYGFVEQVVTGFNKTEDATVWRQEASFEKLSWEEICCKTLGNTCESEKEIVVLQNK